MKGGIEGMSLNFCTEERGKNKASRIIDSSNEMKVRKERQIRIAMNSK